jgi:DNA-binding transcriptional regulator LsrR (DeoR family)
MKAMHRQLVSARRQYERLRSDVALLRWVLWAFRAKGMDTQAIAEARRIPEAVVARLLDDAKQRAAA